LKTSSKSDPIYPTNRPARSCLAANVVTMPARETRLGTSVQGFPLTFSIAGRQYIAVSSGLGGGSPRMVPTALAPEVHYPSYGNALYAFALPEKKQ